MRIARKASSAEKARPAGSRITIDERIVREL
jgi:hypothetical protein